MSSTKAFACRLSDTCEMPASTRCLACPATLLATFSCSSRMATRSSGFTAASSLAVNRYLTRHLRLVVNETKSRIVEADGVEYLGFVFRGRRATINVSEKNQSKFKRRIRQLTGRSRGISMDRRMSELRSYLRGWLGYFGLAAQLKLFDHLDQWLRRRLRMCYWKRWR
jgi:hypothetical protein